jgi:glycerol-3-phosphate dehydrogenase
MWFNWFMDKIYDVAIIGGGINGCGIARDLSGRGLKVLLVEKNDLASGTSSASSKIIHGGLRYLEYFHFRLVKEALKEREVLLKMVPHLISPMRFVLPLSHLTRPKWLIKIGLFLYDHLSRRKILEKSKFVRLKDDVAGQQLKKKYKGAFEYSDCWVDDARLVVLNAVSARENGATILTKTECKSCSVEKDLWNIELQNKNSKNTRKAKVLINVSGPWLNVMKKNIISESYNSRAKAKLIKGSHLIVKKIFNHKKAYLLQKEDNRVIFVFPYEQDFSLIGTTDLDYQGKLEQKMAITQNEINYLLSAANQYFDCHLTSNDVVASFAGVRSLYDDGKSKPQDITRDYFLELSNKDTPPLINIYGGKLTTFRRLAEAVAGKLKFFFQDLQPDWTANSTLPGGDFDLGAKFLYTEATKQLASELVKKYHLKISLAERYAKSYGSLAHKILTGVQKESDLGICFGADLYEKEVNYLLKYEWASSVEDILKRRSKLYLKLTDKESKKLENWLAKK